MPVIHDAQARRIQTPNGTMTTLASPTQGESAQAVWRVDAVPGTTGPLHAFDTESVWTLTAGTCTVQLGPDRFQLRTGDTMVLPPDVLRQLSADTEHGFTAIVAAPAGVHAYNPDGLTAPDACGLVPPGTVRMPLPWAE